ncbi:oxidoreductase [Halomonas sp. TRM85114]|uniref:oxidoreductase n=1 Tax=Halomonas jincaotanensis TaxID=2810616 RepID=UPI001BD44AC8|nr:oxidoreductase [Halomonas jincaotanensis]MBS9402954.1 oxidoreductase [Halomonas jincaotanensis]
MNQTLNVGLVGYGMAGKTFHAPLIEATPTLELTAVVSGDADKVKADLPSVDVLPKAAMLFARTDIDLVVIVTPNSTHFSLAKAALGAGKHVVVDKPVTISLSEARLLKSLAINAERMLSVFHNRRWDSDFLALQEVIASGELGRVASLESRFDRFRPVVPDRWRERRQPGSGLWYDLGPHLLDQAVLLFGMPKAIFVELGSLRDGAQVDDDFLAMLAYERKRVVLQAGTLIAEETPRFRVNGTRGSFVKFGLDPQESWLKEGRRPTTYWGVDPWPGRLMLENGEAGFIERRAPTPPGDYLAYYAGIASALLEGTPPPVSIDDAIGVMTLLELGLDSYRQKRWLNLK